MGAPTVYKWTDTGAPALLPGDQFGAVNVLKACLVDGYGSKTAAGWTMPFESLATGVAVFRNNGTGMFLRVQHNTDSTLCYSGRTMYIESYEAMTDVDTGTNRCPADGSHVYMQVSSWTSGSYACPWFIIADDKCFYFFSFYALQGVTELPADQYYSRFCFCGDIIPIDSSDVYAFAIIGSLNTSSAPYFGYLSTFNAAAAPGHHIQRNMEGDVGAAGFYTLTNALSYGKFGGGSVSYAMLPYPFNGQIYLNPAVINNGVAYTFRGYLPGCYHPAHNSLDIEDTFTEVEIGGTTYMIVQFQSYNSARCCAFFDLSANFRPE